MSFRVVLYCPDRHLLYDGRTPDAVGVGGGVTARVRMARALARWGHTVTQVVNCPRRETIEGVEYVPLDEAGAIEADVAIFNTSGGALDLTPALDLDLDARLRIVWVHGTQPPAGLGKLHYHALYSVSNFLARIVVSQWGVPAAKLFVTYNGYEPSHFAAAEAVALERDPFQLIYFSHPSKGLATAVAVLQELQESEPRFHLEVAGGPRLWGGADEATVEVHGVCHHGLLGQRALTPLLLQSTYAMQLQNREEPGALSIPEARRAGCVIIASPVGCYPEQITDGVDGVIVQGDHREPSARRSAAAAILKLHANAGERAALVHRGRIGAPDSGTLAQAWVQDWLVRLGETQPAYAACSHCGGTAHSLADGDHCSECGLFTRRLTTRVDA